MFVVWNTIQNSGSTYSDHTILSANPSMSNWYRVLSSNQSTSEVILDRGLPNFGSTISSSPQKTNAYFYPFNGVETYYGPGAQKQVQNRMREMSIPFSVNQTWVEPEDMWLYQ